MHSRIETTIAFFEGFTWAIPTAFADAVSQCYFKRGDMLYDAKEAYTMRWGDALNHIRHYIQVKSIPSSEKPNLPDDQERNVFKKNWPSPVEVDLYDHKAGNKQCITITQGALYSLLWKGDLNYVLKKDLPAPIPFVISDMRLKRSKQFLMKVLDAHRRNIKSGCTFVFLMPYDPTNSSSRHKQLRLKEKLKSIPHEKTHIDWGIIKTTSLKSQIAPTLSFYSYEFRGAYEEVYPALKAALYINPPIKNDGKEDAVDMFRIDAHGIIQQL